MTDAEIEDLIIRVSRGERAAFRLLYSAVSGQLYGLCLRVLRDRQLAEDALQEAWIKIWRNAPAYERTGTSPMAWLVTLTRNVAIDRLRSERTAPTTKAGRPFAGWQGTSVMRAFPHQTRTRRVWPRRAANCVGWPIAWPNCRQTGPPSCAAPIWTARVTSSLRKDFPFR